MPRAKRSQEPLALAMPSEIQLVGFEKNLDIMGFFIADEFRGKSDERRPTERFIEYTLKREGRPYLLRYSLKGTSSGLPNSTDKDVWNAVQAIVQQQKLITGVIANPVCFTSMQVLNEMGVPANGSNYKKINDCFTRFKETTIGSSDVVYNAVRKKYNEKHFSVFSRWEKTGASGLDGSDRNEIYQIWLDQIILDNINSGYVQLEDLAAYKRLTRPAAKVLIGNLYFWFGAAEEPYVSRDYKDLCNLLGITCYQHKSKIKEKFGPSLNELIDIGYLSKWDIQLMTSKMSGFKICMWAGPEMVRVLNAVKELRRQKPKALSATVDLKTELSDSQQEAMEALIKQGVWESKARELALCNKLDYILAQIDYALIMIQTDHSSRKKLDNPSGYLVWRISDNIPIPSSFFQAKEREREYTKREAEKAREQALEFQFMLWKDQQIEIELQAQFPEGQGIESKIDELINTHIRPNKVFQRYSEKGRRESALQILKRDIAEELMLPNFEQWMVEHPQGELF
jgi:hypothetical protein